MEDIQAMEEDAEDELGQEAMVDVEVNENTNAISPPIFCGSLPSKANPTQNSLMEPLTIGLVSVGAGV